MSTDAAKIPLTAVITAVMGLLVTESYQSTPWLADKFMRWSVRLRYPDNPERATVRGEELTSLLADLPTLFKLPTAAGFLLRALAHRAAPHRKHTKREPHAVQHPLGARFCLALAKAITITLCTGTAIGVELTIVFKSVAILGPGAYGLAAGIAVASDVVARPWFRPGLIGGITCALPFFAIFAPLSAFRGEYWGVIVSPALSLSSGTAFGLAAAFTGALTGKSRYVGGVISALVNPVGIALAVSASSLSPLWLMDVVRLSGLGIAAGALAGFVAATERRGNKRRAEVPPGRHVTR